MKPHTACYFLENKSYTLPPPPEGFDPNEVLSTPCWCNQTQEAIGPDGEMVDVDGCVPQRACFRPEVDI